MGNIHFQRKRFCDMPTAEMLDLIETEISKLLNVVKNTKKSTFEERRVYIVQVMREAKEFFTVFLDEMDGKTEGGEAAYKETIKQLQKNIDFERKTNQNLKDDIARLEGTSKRDGNMIKSLTARVGNAQLHVISDESTNNTKSAIELSRIPERFKHTDQPGHQTIASLHDLQAEIRTKEMLIESLQDSNQSLETHAQGLKKQLDEMEERNKELTKDNESLLNRLSTMAGQKLTENNPAIADLSDPNRPTKLGEMYSEMYDNEWTDAFEELEKGGYSEEESIETLRLTLLNVIQFCQRKSLSLLEKTEEAVEILFEEFREIKKMDNPKHLTMPRNMSEQWGKIAREPTFQEYVAADVKLQRKWMPKDRKREPDDSQEQKVETPVSVTNQLVVFRKEVAESMVPLVQKAYLSASWSQHQCISGLKPYIKKCLFLGWMMVVQSPPLVLASCKKGDTFNKDMYKDYTKSGPTVQYAVWPALLLHEGGPVIGKGVAQCQNLS